jgi:hypothetical protein
LGWGGGLNRSDKSPRARKEERQQTHTAALRPHPLHPPVGVARERRQLGHRRVLPHDHLVLAVAVRRNDLVDVFGPRQVADLAARVDAAEGRAGGRVPEADAAVGGAAAAGQEAVLVRGPGRFGFGFGFDVFPVESLAACRLSLPFCTQSSGRRPNPTDPGSLSNPPRDRLDRRRVVGEPQRRRRAVGGVPHQERVVVAAGRQLAVVGGPLG